MIKNRIWGLEFNKKEAEIRKLKVELAKIDADKVQPSLFTKAQSIPIQAPLFTSYQPFYNPPKQSTYDQFFGLSHLHSTNPNIPHVPSTKPSSPKKPISKVKISKPPPKEDLQIPEDSHKATPKPPKKDKAPTYQYHYQHIKYQKSDSDSTSEESSSSSNELSSSEQPSSDSESQDADISGLLMATKVEDPSTSTPVVEESSYDNNDDQASQTESVPPVPSVSENSSKPSSSPWFTFDDIPRHKWQARHQEFGAWIDVQMTRPHAQTQNVLREFCSRFTGSLRDWFESLASLPSELQPDLQRKLTATNLSIADISLGKIFQMAMLCLDKICEQKDFFKDLMEDKKSFSEACKKPHLKMECKDDKKCVCSTKKKKHFQKHFHKKSSSKKPFRYFKKKDVSQHRKKKHNHCFIYKKRGHFARNCPHKFAKAVRLIQHLQHSSLLSENEDVESNFSEQSEQDDQTAFIIADSSDSEDISVISTVQNVNHVSTIPRPSLKMSILPSKFHKPVPVIGFIDTGADTSMIDPSVLPSDYWEPHSKLFRAVNAKTLRPL
ncbi:hypothetical protein KPL71_017507 [Citrus sinensis]|uniref:Uncharacterized protein n=1 Tax=Citrus sinensis TaxID=2711 RepID=A0ACB8JQX9_CITSI|nr:hypothetical protein KPL71_017507 [Citrus sinensis]